MIPRLLYFLFDCAPRTLTFVVVFSLLGAAPASAGTITWFASGTLHTVNQNEGFDGLPWPGLTAGTPWTMEITFDPAGPRTGPFGFGSVPCYTYGLSGTTFTLGGFTYTQTGGQVLTNSTPHFGCGPSDTPGMMHFWFGGTWTHEPGAWNINGHLMVAAYRDLLATDGSLPAVPTLHPNQTVFAGMFAERCCPARQFTTSFRPTALTPPTPVPEPATLTLFGAGLAAALAARRRRQ